MMFCDYECFRDVKRFVQTMTVRMKKVRNTKGASNIDNAIAAY